MRCSWFAVGFALLQWVGNYCTTHGTPTPEDLGFELGTKDALRKHRPSQSPPIFHDDQSYTKILPNSGEAVEITPMTIVFDYELRDGEILYTDDNTDESDQSFIPNVDFDYSILEMSSIRNSNRDTGELVSLDEVYVHHLIIDPCVNVASEVVSSYHTDPIYFLPEGYGIEVPAERFPNFRVSSHFMSNKNLAPKDGSVERARKECNECYYAPGKGGKCTPAMTGRPKCCEDGMFCDTTTTTTDTTTTTTKYRIEIDLLVSRNTGSFKPITFWVLFGPLCGNKHRDNCVSVLRERTGGGAPYYHVPEQPNKQPYHKIDASIVSPASGELFHARAHLHAGGVNSTLYLNGESICTSIATHGTNPDSSTNAGNEQNHLIHQNTCDWPDGIRFEIGDAWSWDAYYYGGTDDPRFSSTKAAGEHLNAMSMFIMAINFDQVSVSSGESIDFYGSPFNPSEVHTKFVEIP